MGSTVIFFLASVRRPSEYPSSCKHPPSLRYPWVAVVFFPPFCFTFPPPTPKPPQNAGFLASPSAPQFRPDSTPFSFFGALSFVCSDRPHVLTNLPVSFCSPLFSHLLCPQRTPNRSPPSFLPSHVLSRNSFFGRNRCRSFFVFFFFPCALVLVR